MAWTNWEFEEALNHPEAVFGSPEAVTKCDDLSVSERLAILRQWELGVLRQDGVPEEKQGDHLQQSPDLRQVQEAIAALSATQH